MDGYHVFCDPGITAAHEKERKGKEMRKPKRTICKHFETLQDAKQYADAVNRKLGRRAAFACTLTRLQPTGHGFIELTRYEVAFDTWSDLEF